MSDRTVVVRLMAEIGQYQQQMAAAGKATDRLALQTKKTERMVSNTLGSIRGMVMTFGIPLIGASLVKSFTDFEQQMARVKAVGDPFGQSATGAKRLHDMALEAGQAYGFTANETGQAMEELAKAGVSTGDIMGGVLQSALTLAAAGSITLSDAARHIAVITTQFDLGVGDATRIADQLAKAANATVSGVNEMGTSLSYVGPIAHSMGMSLEDTVATLSLFNKAGLDADMAGTTLRGLLTSLTSPSHMAAMEMAGLNLELYDSQGKMKNVYEIADEMKSKLEDLPPAERAFTLGKIASNAQLQGAVILMKAGGKGIDAMRRLILSQASAEEVAKAKTASFTGEVKKLGAAIESSAIKSMEKLIPLMEPIVKHAKEMAQGFGNMGGGAQLAAVGLAAQLVMARRVNGGLTSFSGAVRKAAQDSATYKQTLDALAQTRPPDMPVKQFDQMQEKLRGTKTELEATRAETGMVKTAMGDMSTSMTSAGTTSQKAMAGVKGAMGVARAGAGNLVNFLGGPWSIILGATIGLVGLWAEEHAKVKRRQEELTASLSDLGTEYAKFGSITSASVRQLISHDKHLRDVAQHASEYGVSVDAIAKAASGETSAQGAVIKSLKDRQTAARGVIEIYTSLVRLRAPIAKGQEEEFLAATKLKDKLDDLIPSLEADFKLKQEIADAEQHVIDLGLADYVSKMGYAFDDVNPMMKTMWENSNILASEQANAADKTNALKASLDLLHGSLNAVSESVAGFRGMSLRDTFMETIPAKEAVEAVKGHEVKEYRTEKYKKKHAAETETSEVFDPVTGKMVTQKKVIKPAWTEDAVRKVWTGKTHIEGAKAGKKAVAETYKPKFDKRMIDDFDGRFRTLVKTNGKLNEELTKTSIEFNSFVSGKGAKILDVVNASFTQATQNGADFGTAAKVAGLRFAQLREELIKSLEPIVGNRQAAEKLVNAYVAIPENIETVFAAPGMKEALVEAGKLGITVEQIPGQKEVYILADTADGKKRLEELDLKTQSLKDGRVMVKFPTWADAKKKLDELDRTRKPEVIPHIKWPTPTEAVPEPGAKFKVPKSDKFEQGIEYDTKVRVTMGIDANTVNLSGGTINMQTPAGKKNRWGGIYTKMAEGGLRQARMEKGGQSLYQWAEKETGGEAFIPRFGNAARSLSILAEAASWYGQQVVPLDRMPAAAGAARPMAPLATQRAGMAAPAPAPVQVRVWLGNEELTDRVRVVVDQHSQNSALQASWGRRA